MPFKVKRTQIKTHLCTIILEMKTKLLLSLIACSVSFALTGQLNFKVGYNGGYVVADQSNNIMQMFNDSIRMDNGVQLEKGFKDIGLMSGLTIGLRYRIGNSAIEFSWDNYRKGREAIWISPSTSESFNTNVIYGMNDFNLGLQYHIGSFGYGGAIGNRRVKISREIGGSETNLTLVNQSSYSVQAYLLFSLKGRENLSLTLKPYVQFPLGSTNVSALSNDLLSSNTTSLEDDFKVYGLAIIFYNGPER